MQRPALCILCSLGTFHSGMRYGSGTNSPVRFHQWAGYSQPVNLNPAYNMPSVHTGGWTISPEYHCGLFLLPLPFGGAPLVLNQLAHHWSTDWPARKSGCVDGRLAFVVAATIRLSASRCWIICFNLCAYASEASARRRSLPAWSSRPIALDSM